VHLLVGALFLVSATALARREDDGPRRYGIDLAGLLTPPDETDPRPAGPLGLYDLGRALKAALPTGIRETAVAVGVAAVLFPPFAFAFQLWHGPERPFSWHFPEDFASFAFAQLIVVGLPEEAFFRGYVQTRLHDFFKSRVPLLGATVSPPALAIQAALFAGIHFVVEPHPARLATFFPGLLFGWLRSWRGGIGAAIVLHAMSNVYARFLERGWL
jgi:hypothetical protein